MLVLLALISVFIAFCGFYAGVSIAEDVKAIRNDLNKQKQKRKSSGV